MPRARGADGDLQIDGDGMVIENMCAISSRTGVHQGRYGNGAEPAFFRLQDKESIAHPRLNRMIKIVFPARAPSCKSNSRTTM
jgi:hypothetical protein